MNWLSELKKSISAGILIGFAGFIYLNVGGVLGSLLFSIGLILVCKFGLNLYTGKAGSVKLDILDWHVNLLGLGKILVGNIIGTIIVSIFTHNLIDPSQIISVRSQSDIYTAFILGIGCGVLMEFAVWGWKNAESKIEGMIIIMMCVTAFIMSGFYHCIADSYYYACSVINGNGMSLGVYLVTILGNFLGCNLRRLLTKGEEKWKKA
jgi:formate/nitrite transporter FocA (FNT family)